MLNKIASFSTENNVIYATIRYCGTTSHDPAIIIYDEFLIAGVEHPLSDQLERLAEHLFRIRRSRMIRFNAPARLSAHR